ncbi:MAG: Rho-binding antiterminator [Candidatus Sedimenticola sp. 20ELBAFRAG]
MTDYQSISCQLHSEYELLAMHRTPVRVSLANSAEPLHGIITDIRAREGAEFLLLKSGDRETEVRLDRIVEISKIEE